MKQKALSLLISALILGASFNFAAAQTTQISQPPIISAAPSFIPTQNSTIKPPTFDSRETPDASHSGTPGAKYGVTFPIAELGNCASPADCKAYCAISDNSTACAAYARKKGFYKQSNTPSASMLAKAKTELGCDSVDACREFCSDSANHDKCAAFAKENNIGTTSNSVISKKDTTGLNGDSNKTLSIAKKILGCVSEASCKAFCAESQNQEKCTEFAKIAGISGGIKKVGPGGCASEDACRAYCETHTIECQAFKEGKDKLHANTQESGSGPSTTGQNTSQNAIQLEKQRFCHDHPQNCTSSGVPLTSSRSSEFRTPPPPSQFPSQTSTFDGQGVTVTPPPFMPPPTTTIQTVKGASTEDSTTSVLNFLLFGF